MVRRSSTRKHRGAGYQTSQQFFNPSVLPPQDTSGTVVSTAPTETAIRPVLNSTFHIGAGKRRTRRSRGGFSPSIMGSFIANAQAAIVPATMYLAYHTMVPKKGRNTPGKGRKSRSRSKASRKGSRRSRRR
jgi:hypothetical protein